MTRYTVNDTDQTMILVNALGRVGLSPGDVARIQVAHGRTMINTIGWDTTVAIRLSAARVTRRTDAGVPLIPVEALLDAEARRVFRGDVVCTCRFCWVTP